MPLCRDVPIRGEVGLDHELASLQLDLPFWPPGTVKEALTAYFQSRVDIAADTVVDYRTRERWLIRVLGESRRLDTITVDVLLAIARREGPHGGSLSYSTITKRFDYLVASMNYAAARRVMSRDHVPVAPRLPDDSRRGGRVLPVAEYATFRIQLLPDRFRRFGDIGYWTGHHTRDVDTMTYRMIEPDFVWREPSGEELWRGRYWRRNHKNRRCRWAWFPMEPELRELALEWERQPHTLDSLIVGPLWCRKKHFDAAADRAGLERVTPNRAMRASFATMLAARGYSFEYIRQAMGHEGAPVFDTAGTFERTKQSTMDTRHYLHLTDDLILRELRRRSKG